MTTVSFVPTMSLTNLLATPAGMRLSCTSSSFLPYYPRARAKSAGGNGSGDRATTAATAAAGGEGVGEGAWSDTIERGDESSWLHCPPDEEASFYVVVVVHVRVGLVP